MTYKEPGVPDGFEAGNIQKSPTGEDSECFWIHALLHVFYEDRRQ
jgi:hypothetical protein